MAVGKLRFPAAMRAKDAAIMRNEENPYTPPLAETKTPPSPKPTNLSPMKVVFWVVVIVISLQIFGAVFWFLI
jgi:hypothetical protein